MNKEERIAKATETFEAKVLPVVELIEKLKFTHSEVTSFALALLESTDGWIVKKLGPGLYTVGNSRSILEELANRTIPPKLPEKT